MLGLKIVGQDILALRRTTRKQGIRLTVFYIPRSEQVYFLPEINARLANSVPSGHSPQELVLHTQEELSRFAQSQHIDFYDLTPDLVRERDKEPLYFNMDKHLTPYGHSAVAKAVYRHLQTSSLSK